MAEKSEDIEHKLSADDDTKESQLANTHHVPDHDGCKQEECDTDVNMKPPEDIDSAEEKKGCPLEKSSAPDKGSAMISNKDSLPPQTDDGGQGDGPREISRNEQQTMTVKYHTEEKERPEAAAHQGDRKGDKLDGPKAQCNEELTATDLSGTENDRNPSNEVSTLKEEDNDPEEDSSRTTAETLGPTTQETIAPDKSPRVKYHTGKKERPEAAAHQGDRRGDKLDGPKAQCNEELTATDLSDDQNSPNEVSTLKEEDNDPEDSNRTTAETLGPTTQETIGPDEISRDDRNVPDKVSALKEEDKDPGDDTTSSRSTPPKKEEKEDESTHLTTKFLGGKGGTLMFLLTGVLLAIVMHHLLHVESPPQMNDEQKIDIFLRQLEKVKSQFPNQRAELWKRSRIHLLRHLQTVQPSEPVSLILTAGLRAERTLHCLAQELASAFSSALNASVLHIDGASKASQDSDQVKLDIDSNLQGAFEGDKPVAVIHRFEELPPGSTLIFYRYCDHENAAYKKTCLIFTVLLDEEEEIPAMSRLSTVEEMVDDHLQKKFLSGSHPVSYDRMDLDKYGGLWSRISHLILPVAAEEMIEHEGC